MNRPSWENIASFIRATGDLVYLRDVDRIMIIRPNRLYHLNNTAFEILRGLYAGVSPESLINSFSGEYSVPGETVYTDIISLLDTINRIINEDFSSSDMIKPVEFDPGRVKYPVISEIALTYSCQNRCEFCYASSPYRGNRTREMNTADVKKVIDKIFREAHVPTISFTGGEPTLRDDLPELVAYASGLGMRTNLITNGIRCSRREFVAGLKEAGLNSAQVSLEGHCGKIHDSITGLEGSFESTVNGIMNLKDAGIYTHTNSTICRGNRDSLIELVDFVRESFQSPYLSMNMVIKTGIARDNENINISYGSIGALLDPVIRHCEVSGIKLVWYSPTPYCLFNPVDKNLGSKSCACISGLLSVNPRGEILPCSSYNRGVGNLLKESFDHIWNSDEALYYRERRYVPPVCRSCEYETLCGGACPLYWENAGSFSEIETVRKSSHRMMNALWKIEKKLRVKSRGINGIKNPGGNHGKS